MTAEGGAVPQSWEDPDPGFAISLTSAAAWSQLADLYPTESDVLVNCLKTARLAGAKAVVVETRYVDVDYRSEYSAYYSLAFESIKETTHRLHFFDREITDAQMWDIPDDAVYLGYMILRPRTRGRVGRTMLRPPKGIETAVRTSAEDAITLFGQPFTIKAVPFMEQDAHLDRCAHTAVWIAHYSAYLRGEVARRPVAAFSLLANHALGRGRVVPSDGLTVAQVQDLLRRLDLPPIFHDTSHLPPSIPMPKGFDPRKHRKEHPGLWDPRIISICCSYLNSGLPVIIGTADHAFVLCGYERKGPDGHEIRFVRQDDQEGPYRVVEDLFDDKRLADKHPYSPWLSIIVPLPEEVWVPSERVEYYGKKALRAWAQGWARAAAKDIPDADAYLIAEANDNLAFRTYVLPTNTFKHQLAGRVDPDVAREYGVARFPRHIWVVEAVSKPARQRGEEKAVVAEALFDPTSSHLRPMELAVRIPGLVVVKTTSGTNRLTRCRAEGYRTGGVGPL